MPTEIVMATAEKLFASKSRHHQSSYSASMAPSNIETMSGNLTLVSMNGRRQGVHVKVYITSLEHFAVLYPQKKICRPLGVINLKNTQLEVLPDKQPAFLVRQLGFDTPMALTFVSESSRELDSWIGAFTTRGSHTFRHSSLPVVEEDEEV